MFIDFVTVTLKIMNEIHDEHSVKVMFIDFVTMKSKMDRVLFY